VIFGKTKGAKMVKDIRIEKLDAATTVKGVLIDIKADENSAVFVSSVNNVKYNMALSEVVSCEKSLIKENQEVDGVLHEGKIYGGKRNNYSVQLSQSLLTLKFNSFLFVIKSAEPRIFFSHPLLRRTQVEVAMGPSRGQNLILQLRKSCREWEDKSWLNPKWRR
jgi:predicted DNA binding protein